MKKLLLATLVIATFGTARAANPVVVIDTSMGKIKVELFEDKAPVTVKNFLAYTDEKFYDGTIFHRVMGKENSGRDFMIQGGGFEPGMKEKRTKPPIVNESTNGVSNKRGTIAMARTSNPNSATSQFYINVADNTPLDKSQAADGVGYCAFGKVIEGMEVIDKIKAVKTTSKAGHNNVPADDIIIKSVRREPKKDEKKDEKK
jgi:cyclophilin family peptidyl-prolyl cis-trans isomerase